MKYLILTKSDPADASKWGLGNNLAIIVKEDGAVETIASPELAGQTTPQQVAIAVINMGIRSWHPDLQECVAWRDTTVAYIKSLLCDSPRVWVHFGGQASNDSTATYVSTAWSAPKYLCLRNVFTSKDSGPMPYSQANSAHWDRLLKDKQDIILGEGLSLAIRTALVNNTRIDLTNKWSSQLETAWQEASKVYRPEAIQEAIKTLPRLDALKTLLAVAIYCDGFGYALTHPHANNKLPEMRKQLVKEVPAIISPDLVAALNADEQPYVTSLKALTDKVTAVSYTHLTLPTIYSV